MNTKEDKVAYFIAFMLFFTMFYFGYLLGRVELKHHLCQLKQYEYCGKKELLDKLQ